jgi:hypothetical protein
MARSEGLGDTIAKITHFFGIDKLAEKIAHLFGYEDCGCTRRKSKLNKLFSYKKKKNDKKIP